MELVAPALRWVDRKLLEEKAFGVRGVSLVREERGSWAREASAGHRKHIVTEESRVLVEPDSTGEGTRVVVVLYVQTCCMIDYTSRFS